MEKPKTRVLVVEDNPADVRLLEAVLEQNNDNGDGFQFIYETSLMGTFQRLDVERVDAVLLDLFLPDAFGLDAVRKVRDTYPQMPIIVLSGLFDQRIGEHAIRMGANQYFAKEQLTGQKLMAVLQGYARSGDNNNKTGVLSGDKG